ncbi:MULTISPECIES: hypothetical protein [Rhodococcus]|uniref:hypothetical protein n=1 Tax=Rhodococcus TaxID=1827 RepID=UPI001E40A75D|nr:hypothetical protein [Rhodococcus pyridinivorans]MCD2115886.1 hypothetical protein [Rhodococcus pyridinivorans]MCZ4624748.1 hypothetical protein [Rhodococcus pyridinivorans]MCZ4645959.1 hypothetical protein [Rhodococcus pyridinivorans]MDJ0483639.1 hypothetical protein [Rhodococcus pyridinivorans]MDV7252085.1 hypothetical protein [Rhodococcus pyridinivorans]
MQVERTGTGRIATRTERGDRMFAVMVERSCAAIRDLDSLTVVSESIGRRDRSVGCSGYTASREKNGDPSDVPHHPAP